MPQHYLVKVDYRKEKNEILCYFEGENDKIVERYRFFPYFVLQPILNPEQISELLISLGFRSFEIQKKGRKNLLVSNSFENLKKASSIIAKTTNKKHLVLETERVFLLEKNWSYFDCFDSDLKKVNEKDFAFSLFPKISFREAHRLNPLITNSILEQSAFSKILRIPINKIPETIQEKAELFLENIYFKSGGIISWENEDSFFTAKQFPPYGLFETISQIDFSNVWVQLITNNFFNLGQESINCSCCKPVHLNDKKLLPNSLIAIKPIENNLYFQSSSSSFAFNFHKNNPFIEDRKLRKKEFFLKEFPVGPLLKNSIYLVPINDAKQLLDEEKVELSKDHKLYWSCEKESFLSREIRKLNKVLFEEKKFCEQTSLIEHSFSKQFTNILISSLNILVSELPFHLTNPFSKFFTPSLASSILSIQESTMHKFREFSEKNGFRVLHTNKKSAFVRGYSSLSLAEKFSKETSLPQPLIANFAKKARLE